MKSSIAFLLATAATGVQVEAEAGLVFRPDYYAAAAPNAFQFDFGAIFGAAHDVAFGKGSGSRHGHSHSSGSLHGAHPLRSAPVYGHHSSVPSCVKRCAKATIRDAWDNQFGTGGSVEIEQSCNGKATIRGDFDDLKVNVGRVNPPTSQQAAPAGQGYKLTINQGKLDKDVKPAGSGICADLREQSQQELGKFYSDRNGDSEFFKKLNLEGGIDGVIGSAVVVTATGDFTNYQRIACGQIEEVRCR